MLNILSILYLLFPYLQSFFNVIKTNKIFFFVCSINKIWGQEAQTRQQHRFQLKQQQLQLTI